MNFIGFFLKKLIPFDFKSKSKQSQTATVAIAKEII